MVSPKAQDLPGVEGPGISTPKFRDIDRLADKYVEALDEATSLKTTMEDLETDIIAKMEEHHLALYKFSDRKIILKAGKTRIKIKPCQPEPAEE